MLNLWTIVLHLCLENQDLNFAMRQDFYFYVLLQNDHQLFFFCFLGFFTDFFLGCLGLVFLLNFLINLFPSHRIRLQMITPPKNPPPPGFKMILRLTSGSTIALANFRTSS